MKNLSYVSAGSSGLLRRMVGVVATVALISLVLMFSAVVFAVLLLAGVVAWGYLWWKMRGLRKQMRSFHAEVVKEDIIAGEVIEGVAIRVDEARNNR